MWSLIQCVTCHYLWNLLAISDWNLFQWKSYTNYYDLVALENWLFCQATVNSRQWIQNQTESTKCSCWCEQALISRVIKITTFRSQPLYIKQSKILGITGKWLNNSHIDGCSSNDSFWNGGNKTEKWGSRPQATYFVVNHTVHIHSRLNREKTGQLPTETKCCPLRGMGGGVQVSCRVLDSSHQFPSDNDKSG